MTSNHPRISRPVTASADVSADRSLPIRLTELRAGDHGVLFETGLPDDSGELLDALGLAEQSAFRVCQVGNPWILKVRNTRIGISPAVAEQIRVIPECPLES